MASEAVITWASKDEAVARTLEKTERGFDQLLRKIDAVEKATKKSAEATTQGFDAAISKVGQFVLAFTGVGNAMAVANAAANQLKKEYETLRNQQKAAADANLQLADVLPGTVRQFGGLLGAKDVEAAVSRVSGATGVDQVKVAQAIGEAAAARGATNRQQAQEAIAAAQAALRFAPEADPQTIASLAGGTTDLQRRFGISAEQSIGFLARVGGQARVTSLREQVQNINPAIGALAAFGMSPQAAGGLVSSLTGASGDFTGAMSRTASIQLAKQLEERGFATPEAGIAAMQADPELRRRFFEGGRFGKQTFAKASFEAAQFPFIRELLTGGSALAQNYAAATREVGTFQQGGETFEQMIGEINSLDSVRLSRLRRGFSQAAGDLRLRDIVGAEGAISREGYSSLLDAAGVGATEQSLFGAEFESATFGGTRAPAATVASRLRSRASGLRNPIVRGIASEGGIGESYPREATPSELSRAEVFERVAALLEELVRESKAQTAEMKRPDAPQSEPRPSAALAR